MTIHDHNPSMGHNPRRISSTQSTKPSIFYPSFTGRGIAGVIHWGRHVHAIMAVSSMVVCHGSHDQTQETKHGEGMWALNACHCPNGNTAKLWSLRIRSSLAMHWKNCELKNRLAAVQWSSLLSLVFQKPVWNLLAHDWIEGTVSQSHAKFQNISRSKNDLWSNQQKKNQYTC